MATTQPKSPSVPPVAPYHPLGGSRAGSGQFGYLKSHLFLSLLSPPRFLAFPTLEPRVLLSQRTRPLPSQIRTVCAKQHLGLLANWGRGKQFRLLSQGGFVSCWRFLPAGACIKATRRF